MRPLAGLGLGEGTKTLGLDLKGAFNSVLLGVLVRQLVDLRVSGRILNYFSRARRGPDAVTCMVASTLVVGDSSIRYLEMILNQMWSLADL